ncbi:MAG: hypothetical protein Fur0012_12110 [Elusimicrobiota bacterium]
MKNKNSLYLLVIVTILAASWSGREAYRKIKIHLYGDSVEINPPAVQLSAETKPKDTLPEPQPSDEKKVVTVEEKLPETAKEQVQELPKPKAVKTIFKYKNKKAKKVSLSGSFLKWHEKAMKGKNGEWQTEEFILPGNYFYHFVVDGKKTLDPNAPKTPMGESLISVK